MAMKQPKKEWVDLTLARTYHSHGRKVNIYESNTENMTRVDEENNPKNDARSIRESAKVEEKLKLVIDVLSQKKIQATPQTISFFQEMPFFKNLNLQEKEIGSLMKTLTLQTCQAQEIVTEIGDRGETFYIILQGTVSVSILAAKQPQIAH